MNGCWLSQLEWERGDRILINTDAIKHIDVIEQASNLDKLYSNGWSHNDILKLRGKPPIDEDGQMLEDLLKTMLQAWMKI